MIELSPLPLSAALLERYRLKTLQRRQADLVGGHQMRRKGQSLEFYQFRQYIPGDDIRHVDWRASARRGQEHMIVKEFTAEEHLSLVISIDTRDTMLLPEAMPKLRIAAWLAEAVTRIALRSGDRVVLHRLFGSGTGGIETLKGTSQSNRVRPVLSRLMKPLPQDAPVNLWGLGRHLPPTAVWFIISDCYFDAADASRKLAARMSEAQDGWRWVILLEPDAWPYERQFLGLGARRVEGPGTGEADLKFEITGQSLESVEARIRGHKESFRNKIRHGALDYVCWLWPEKEPDPETWFIHRFGEEPVLRRLFMRGKAV